MMLRKWRVSLFSLDVGIATILYFSTAGGRTLEIRDKIRCVMHSIERRVDARFSGTVLIRCYRDITARTSTAESFFELQKSPLKICFLLHAQNFLRSCLHYAFCGISDSERFSAFLIRCLYKSWAIWIWKAWYPPQRVSCNDAAAISGLCQEVLLSQISDQYLWLHPSQTLPSQFLPCTLLSHQVLSLWKRD